MPVHAQGGEMGASEYVLHRMPQPSENVRGGVIEKAVHWLTDEQPEELANRLLSFSGEND